MTTLEAPQSYRQYGQYGSMANKKNICSKKLQFKKERQKSQVEQERSVTVGLPTDDTAWLTTDDTSHILSNTTASPLVNKILAKAKAAFKSTRNFEDWFFLALLGLIMALLAYLIDKAIVTCAYAHIWLCSKLDFHPILQYLAWVIFTIVLILFGTGFVNIVSPNAIGSGIPEMKTILRGVILKEYLSLKTGISKAIGLIAALGSGLPFGREGPLVHLSSIIATQLDRWRRTKGVGVYENESRHTEMLAAACAVGVACTFSAPIGGVLFSIEVTATLFAVHNYWRGFYAAVWSALMFRLLQIAFNESNLTAIFQTTFRHECPYHDYEILAFVFLGVLCGLGGALFVYCHGRFVRLIGKFAKFWQTNLFIYPFLVALIVSTITCPTTLGKWTAGGGLRQRAVIRQLFSNYTWTGPDSNQNTTLKAIPNDCWSNKDEYDVYMTLLTYFLANFWMGLVCKTLPVPAGTFIPVFVLGACLGRIIGEAMATLIPGGHITPGGYAVVGAAAFSGAATHTISTTVIACEMTGQIEFILPLTCAVLIANLVAKSLETNIFDLIIRIKKLPYLPPITNANSSSYNIFVEDFMIKDFLYVTYNSTTYAEIRTLLMAEKQLRAYPLVDSHQHMILLGSVQRAELQLLLDEQIGPERRLLPPDEHSGVSTPAASASRRGSHDSTMDTFTSHAGGLEQVKEQLRAMDHYYVRDLHPGHYGQHDVTAAWNTQSSALSTRLPTYDAKTGKSIKPNQSTDEPASLSAPPTLHGPPNFDINPGKSILNNQSIDDLEDAAAVSTPPKRLVCEMSKADREYWLACQLAKTVDYTGCDIDPAPFMLAAVTSLHKVHSLFSLLALKQAYVTNIGRLVGIVCLSELRTGIKDTLSHKMVHKPIFPPEEDDVDLLMEVDNEGGIPMGPRQHIVHEADEQHQIAKPKPDFDGALDLNKYMRQTALHPMKIPEPVRTRSSDVENKLASLFKPMLDDILATLPAAPAALTLATAEAATAILSPIADVAVSKFSLPFSPINPTVLVTLASPPDISAPLNATQPMHSPSCVQGSRFPNESKSEDQNGSHAAALAIPKIVKPPSSFGVTSLSTPFMSTPSRFSVKSVPSMNFERSVLASLDRPDIYDAQDSAHRSDG